VHYLVQSHNIFGIEIQNWMLIVAVLVIAFIFFIRRTRDGA